MTARTKLAPPPLRTADWLPWLVLASCLALTTPSHALYKVIGPDGKVTYTDRVPGVNEGKISPLGSQTVPVAADVVLPLELRQAVSRYPVTLYTTSGACEPCEAARQLLRQRGVPHSEKQVLSPEDGEALQRLSGGLDAPTLTIGGQTLRGLASEVWGSYLDSAGYPRESRLPQGYQFPAPTPITERREAAPRTTPRAEPTAADAPPPAPPPPRSGFRF